MADGNYRKDRQFGDSLMAEVKSILGQFLLRDDFTEEDCKRNTDLMLALNIKTKPDGALRIGVRIRSHYYYLHYPDDFTIRYERKNGAQTEFRKIMDGWGDYFFYGFTNEDNSHLIKWIIGDFEEFRKIVNDTTVKHGLQPWQKGKERNDVEDLMDKRVQYNKGEDGSGFLAFKANTFKGFVVANSDEWNMKRAS